jgi:hypothetical protein
MEFSKLCYRASAKVGIGPSAPTAPTVPTAPTAPTASAVLMKERAVSGVNTERIVSLEPVCPPVVVEVEKSATVTMETVPVTGVERSDYQGFCYVMLQDYSGVMVSSSNDEGYETADDVSSDDGYMTCDESSDDEEAVAVLGDKCEHALCAEGLLKAVDLGDLDYAKPFFVCFDKSGELRIARKDKRMFSVDFYASDFVIQISNNSERSAIKHLSYLQAVLPDSAFRYVINLPDFKHHNTPAMLAMKKGFFGLVQRLADLGADLSKPDIRGLKPVHLAAIFRDSNMIRLCLEHGDGEVNVRTVLGDEVDARELYEERIELKDFVPPLGIKCRSIGNGFFHIVDKWGKRVMFRGRISWKTTPDESRKESLYQETKRAELSDLRWHIAGRFSDRQLFERFQKARNEFAEELSMCEDLNERSLMEKDIANMDKYFELEYSYLPDSGARLFAARHLFCEERNAIPIDDTIPW